MNYGEKQSSGWEAPLALKTTLPLAPVSTPAIHAAVYNPNLSVETIEAMVAADPLLLESVELQFGYTALHCAAKRCSMPLIKMLVHHGAMVDSRASGGETPLMVACESGSLFVVHTLCECGAEPSLVDSNGQSTLHYAAKAGAVHILHYLSMRGTLDLRTTDNQGNTLLHCATRNHKLDTVEYLIRHNRCDPGSQNQEGHTAVHYAAKYGSIPMCWMLLNKDINQVKNLLQQMEKNGLTPLDIANRGPKRKHEVLAKRLKTWSVSPEYMRLFPWGWWVFFSLLGGASLLLALLAFTQIFQPLGTLVTLLIIFAGFFYPLSWHRIPHPAGWPNPLMVGEMLTGIILTSIVYLYRVFPVVWPDYCLSFLFLTATILTAIVLFLKLRKSNPGFDKIGKLGRDGKPLTIMDVAGQAENSPHGFSYLEGRDPTSNTLLFCTKCEIVIPEYTKHCKLCEGCCRGFDHHCVWLGRCVGYNNHRVFLIFLILLMLDNFLYVYQAVIMMGRMGNSSWAIFSVGFSTERAAMMLVLCNLLTGLYAALNLWQQLLLISRMETGYFDFKGHHSSKKRKKYSDSYSLITRVRLVILFFTNYPAWFSRRSKHLTLTV